MWSILIHKLQETDQTDTPAIEGIAEITEDAERPTGPPEATVARRAKSYSDFYDIVQAHLRKERVLEKRKRLSRTEIKTDLEFGEWYYGVSEELLDASHEQYKSVYSNT
jgi:conserved oligomeric Golgi complex subunit 3